MEINENISEYYEELFPVTSEQKRFYEKYASAFKMPVKYLRIGCGTGFFEHSLAKNGADVTALETCPELLESANRRRRTQLMAIRFFQMSSLEMSRFLGKGFYNIISILDSRIIFTHDDTLIAKLFFDCKSLLSDNGKFIIGIDNFEKFGMNKTINLGVRESVRAKLYTQIKRETQEKSVLNQNLETGNGRILSVMSNVPVCPLTSEQIITYAKDAGFKHFDCFSGFDFAPATEKSDALVMVLS